MWLPKQFSLSIAIYEFSTIFPGKQMFVSRKIRCNNLNIFVRIVTRNAVRGNQSKPKFLLRLI